MEKFVRTSMLILGFVLLIALVQTITEVKFIKLADMVKGGPVVTAKERERQLDCLAINIYREAGNEPFEGKVGVAQVTLNRTATPGFPKDVCAVVYQKNNIMEKVVCQFSWYCDSAHRSRVINNASYKESYEVAQKVLLEDFRLPGLKEALYYHADYVNPQWRLDRVAKIGAHIFYKPRDKDF